MSARKLAVAILLLGSLAIYRSGRAAEDGLPDAQAKQAREVLLEGLKKYPENAVLWLQLGFNEKRLGDVDAAQRAFEKVVSLNPQNADAYYMLGLIYEKKKLKDQAVAAWKSCLANTKEDPIKEVAQKHLSLLQK